MLASSKKGGVESRTRFVNNDHLSQGQDRVDLHRELIVRHRGSNGGEVEVEVLGSGSTDRYL